MATREVRWPTAARVSQANAEWPWLSCQGWKWSLLHTASNPAFSAASPSGTSWVMGNCSSDSTKPMFGPEATDRAGWEVVLGCISLRRSLWDVVPSLLYPPIYPERPTSGKQHACQGEGEYRGTLQNPQQVSVQICACRRCRCRGDACG